MTTNTFERKDVYRDVDLSLTKHPLTGDVGVKRDVNAINQSIKNLVSTNFFERPFQPLLGCNIRGMLFENFDPIVAADLRTAIMDTINNYEPRVSLQDVIVADNADRNAYSVTIVYEPELSSEVVSLDVHLERLR